MIDLEKVLERQELYNKNPHNIYNVLSRLAIMKRSLYYHKIISSIDTFTFFDRMTIDAIRIEYQPTGKYIGQINNKIVDISTGIDKIEKLKIASDDKTIINLENTCSLYGEIVQESLNEIEAFSSFKITTKWVPHSIGNYAPTGQCYLTFDIVKE